MRSNNLRRFAVVAWPVVLGAVVLASCGSDTSTGATASTIDLAESTNYIVKDPVTTTAAPLIADPEGPVEGAQTYVVQSGDYPLKVANDFGVSLDELVAFNEWATADEFPFPGEEIGIPPGANNAATVVDDTATADEATTGETIPDAGDNCAPGRHTVVAGDFPLSVAKQYDVTIESLDAANAGNPAYGQFVPGQEIIIPAKSDC